MTTVIVTDEGMFADGRTTADTKIISDCAKKVTKYKGYVFACVGDGEGADLIAKGYIDGLNQDEWGLVGTVEGSGIIRRQDGFFVGFDSSEDGVEFFNHNGVGCFGSGCEFAQAAMDFGKSPVEAIKYAMTRDSLSGGKITSVLFKNLEGN